MFIPIAATVLAVLVTLTLFVLLMRWVAKKEQAEMVKAQRLDDEE